METNDLNKLTASASDLRSEDCSETTSGTGTLLSEETISNVSHPEMEEGPHPEDDFSSSGPNIADLEKIDWDTLSKSELVARLKMVVQTYSPDQLKDEVEGIKSAFYKQYKQEVEEIKKRFVESGELEENFSAPNDPLEHELKELIKVYRDKRSELNESIEEEKERNLRDKQEVIENIKALVNRQESLNDTFREFRDLQQRWRDIGPVPQSHVRDLWANYNYAIESFYNYININKELRDLDLKKNLELKLELCEKAENLLREPNIVHAFNTLQKFHDEWRETGPVPKEKKDEVWERFKEATSLINKKHQEHFESIKDQLKKNLDAKTELCEKAELIIEALGKVTSPKEWEDKSKELIELQQMWKTIGFAPKKDNNRIYERFRSACDRFFELKRDYFKDYKSEQHNNLQLKTELCLQAEALKNSTDWKKTTDEFVKIQKRWKEIGPVPRKLSDPIWKRFRSACDEFFAHKSTHFSSKDGEEGQNLQQKLQIIEQLKAFEPSENPEETFKALQEIQRRWSEIGHVPFKEKDRVNNEFRGMVNRLFDNLNLDEFHKNISKFGNKIEGMKGNGGLDKVNQERNKIITKLRQLEADITVWENNIGFFAKSKNSDALVRDFNNKIETGKRNIKLLNEKLDMLDEMLKAK
ncbi:uncharacterized protein DUF349 [Breznakibacter xylanolyticus]|uniref:Uncharacterized protein DUF349 n=1 Tax=Breznakibacter xylanolyticus TaxID=990 RepID=A0A2W7NQC1_9BACT|nr:DUF349 domain-containing protein [Breznakibacter xylanolyticus]PZX20317.1 uncharacterized protein DUF349 [Breznakibacter xylanolyticus]